MAKQQRKDGWHNLATLLGTSADKRTHARTYWEFREPEFYEELYASGGIPARIVDLIPEESLRHWLDFTDVDPAEAQRMHDVCQNIDLKGAIGKSWRWGRAYGGGLMYIVTNTKDPASPLQKGEKIIGLRDLSRWDIRILTTDVEFDFASVNWGHPRLYYLNVQMGSQFKGYPIHWTRVIRFDGQLVPRRTYIRNNYWHDSILNRIYNSIRNYEQANDSVAASLLDFNVDVIKMKHLHNMIAAGNEKIAKQRVEMMNYSKSVVNALLLDQDLEEYENVKRNMEGVAELLVHQANRLVAETDIPHTKLLGESPDGSNATGNSTSQQWYNFIASEQENYLRPKLKRIFSLLFGKDVPFKFRTLRVLDDTEKADVRLKTAQADEIYINSQVLDPTEIADSRFGGDEYSMETTLDKEGRANGSVDPAANEIEEEVDDPKSTTGEDPEDEDNDERLSDKPAKPANNDVTGKPKKKAKKDAAGEEQSGVEGDPGTQYGVRNEMIKMQDFVPKTKSFISQTESLPMRDPKTDPPIKGPGIPNKSRTILPTRGNGVTAESGFDFVKDAGKEGEPRDGLHVDEEPDKQKRAATIIVKRDGHFLMGQTNKDGKWTLPGGHVEDKESFHQGGVRELEEETGLKATKLKFLGSRLVENQFGKPTWVAMYEYNHKDEQKVTTKNDPDKEVRGWKWFPVDKALDDEVIQSLKHRNNIALEHLKLIK